ncbi:hypothetical protein A6R68_09225, partial [Neotoma lepida]
MAMRQTPLTCSGHTRPVVDLAFSGITPYGYFLISACKGTLTSGSVFHGLSKLDRGVVAPLLLALVSITLVSSDCVVYIEDSNYLLTGGQDKLLRIYDLNKPEA